MGLSQYLNQNRLSDKALKDKVDYLENEIKLWILIKKIFEFIKQWFIIFQNYHFRESKIYELKQALQDIHVLYETAAQERGEAEGESSPASNEQIEAKKNSISGLLDSVGSLNSELYTDILDTVKNSSKLLNYSLKFLNNPEYYLKSNRVASMSPPVRKSSEIRVL